MSPQQPVHTYVRSWTFCHSCSCSCGNFAVCGGEWRSQTSNSKLVGAKLKESYHKYHSQHLQIIYYIHVFNWVVTHSWASFRFRQGATNEGLMSLSWSLCLALTDRCNQNDAATRHCHGSHGCIFMRHRYPINCPNITWSLMIYISITKLSRLLRRLIIITKTLQEFCAFLKEHVFDHRQMATLLPFRRLYIKLQYPLQR